MSEATLQGQGWVDDKEVAAVVDMMAISAALNFNAMKVQQGK